MPYNRFNAFIYQLILFIGHFNPGFIHKPWVRKVRDNCKDDWAEFRTQVTIKELDEDIEELHAYWDTQEAEDSEFIFTEEKSDGSEAQELLGGPMELSAPWKKDESKKQY